MVNKWMILTAMIKGEGPKSINDHKSILCSYISKKLNVQGGSELTFLIFLISLKVLLL